MNDPNNFSDLNLIELERLASTWAEEYPIIEKIALYSGKILPHSGKEPKTYYVIIVRICKRPYRKDAEYQNYKDLLEWTCESCMHIQNELERAYKEASIGYHLEWAWFNLEPDDELPTEFISLKYPWILYVKEDVAIDRKALDTREEIQEPDPNSQKEKALDTCEEIQEPDLKSKKENVLDTHMEIQKPSSVVPSPVKASSAEPSSAKASTSEDIDDSPENHNNSFTLKGEYWAIRYRGKETHIRNLERIRYIINLLDNPGVIISSHRLASLVKGNEPQSDQILDKLSEEQLQKEGLTQDEILTNGDTEEDYEKLKNELRRLWERCITSSDTEKARIEWENGKNIAQNEYGIIVNDFGKDLKFFKKEKLKKEVEKARSNVSKQISLAIKDFEEKLPSLAEHLKKNISRGAVCIYNTDTENPISWNITW